MPALVQNNKSRKIKNLGWLIRNWKLVERFQVVDPDPKRTQSEVDLLLDGLVQQGINYNRFIEILEEVRNQAILVAHLRQPGEMFWVGFSCKETLRLWLDRPIFRGAEIQWFGKNYKVGQIPAE